MRVALLEDHGVLSEAMRISLVRSGFDVDVVPLPTEAVGTEELVRRTLSTGPDIALLDLDLGAAGDGAHLISPLTVAGCPVVVLTANSDTTAWGACLARGALAVLSKSDRLSTVVDTLTAAVRGVPTVRRDDRQRLIALWQQREADRRDVTSLLARLTPREREVLAGLVAGHRVAEIARQGHVSPETVRTQVKSILGKLQVTSQIAAIALVRGAGVEASWREEPRAPEAPVHRLS